MASKLFVFNRGLPAPFDKVPKAVKGVHSMYSDSSDATLSATVAKAVLAYGQMMQGTTLGGLGQVNGKNVAEYKSASGNEYHLVVHDPSTGNLLAVVYDPDLQTMEQYAVGNKTRDGAALMLALIPELMRDPEFKSQMIGFCEAQQKNFPDMTEATNALAMLCDNAYRRISDDACAAHVKAKADNGGNIMRLSKTHLDSGTFEPQIVFAGEFSVLAKTSRPPVFSSAPALPNSDFEGQFRLNPGRVLAAKEQALVPALEPWYILPEQIVSVCKHAQASTGKPAQMRNFALRGPAGTGKTKGAEAIAAGLQLPYVKYTCSANTEVFDFIGQVFPDTAGASTGDESLDAQRKELLSMGGMTYENVARLMQLPGLDDMDYAPTSVFEQLTGTAKANATSQDCMAAVLSLVTEKVSELCRVQPENSGGGQSYTYTETDFVRALKHGWVIELQEPTCILQPGVLVGLNALLEQSGSVTLPTGEIIRRHPDAVVVITTNTSYEGCRGMNQSVMDRMNLVYDIELPDEAVMAQRAMSVTGCEDDTMVSQMVKVVTAMADFCRKNGIEDGAVGMRSLIDWIISAEITGDAYTSALYTVVSKATADGTDREALITAALEPYFTRARAVA